MCWAVHICFRAYHKNKAMSLSGLPSAPDMGGMDELSYWETHRFLEESDDSSSNSTDTCDVSPIADPLGEYFQEPWTMVIYLLGMFYMFFGLGYVCEEFFVCSIEKIILEYQIPPDVAGATLMAAGSSSPELFAELVGCFVSEEVRPLRVVKNEPRTVILTRRRLTPPSLIAELSRDWYRRRLCYLQPAYHCRWGTPALSHTFRHLAGRAVD